MNRPRRFLLRMALFLGAVLGVVGLLYPAVERAFMVNPGLNGLIVGIIVIGIVMNVRQVLMLGPENAWLESFRRGQTPVSTTSRLRLLAPMARMLGEHRERFALSTTATRSLLDSISSRLDESRDISRYFVGLCIFLGLLGTFWGLLETVASIGDVIRGLTITGDDVAAVFNDLKRGLESPLAGMGTAFSSSLLGLSGSLVLGFLDLQASQAQNDFYNGLEDWLASQTRLGGGAIGDGGEQSVPAYIQALLEQTADSLSDLQHTLARGEEDRAATNVHLRAFAEKVTTLADQTQAGQALLQRFAEVGSGGGSLDEATRGHIRNLDATLVRLVEEMATGRERMIKDIRSEIKLLARTIAALAEEAERQ
ncbi:MAG: flagellar motor protein MotA [Alphaproteobacteria bacterium]